VESAAAAFLNASLVYVPSVVMDYSLEDRDHSGAGTSPIGDFESLQEFSKIFGAMAEESRKTQDNFLAMMREAQRVCESAKRAIWEFLIIMIPDNERSSSVILNILFRFFLGKFTAKGIVGTTTERRQGSGCRAQKGDTG
jgi:hypothetical protein